MPFSWAGDAVDYVGSALSDAGTAVGNAASSVGSGIADAASAVGSGISDAASAVGSALGIGGDAGSVGTLAQDTTAATAGTGFTGAVVPTAAPGVGAGASAIAAPASADVIDSTDPALAVGGAAKGADMAATPDTAGWSSPPNGTGSAATPSLSQISGDVSAGNYGQAVSDVGSKLGANSSWLVPAGSLGASMLLGNSQPKGSTQVSQEAAQLSTAGQQLQSYITNGTLPPGVQSAITSASATSKAAVKANYAKMGMSGSTAEAADLAAVDQAATTQGTNIALQLLQQGVSDTQISSQLYGELMKNAISSDNSLVSALSSLASASARPTVTLNTGS